MSVSGYFDRDKAERNRAQDALSKPDRILDLGRGIASLIPEPADIPELRVIPGRIKSWSVGIDEIMSDNPVRQIVDKINAEYARVLRLLPPAPPGMYWHLELQTCDEDLDFTRNRASLRARIVAELYDERTHKPPHYECTDE